jgi:proteasome lid subunit RPN8/RPN11
MTDQETLSYSVIITITLPGEAGKTSLRLTLGPADELPGPDGTRRLLQDCTLAELQQFADALEANLWRDYLDATLVDLVVDEKLQIDFDFVDGQAQAAPSGQLLLDHVVLFPEETPQAEPRGLSQPEPDSQGAQVETVEPADDKATVDQAPPADEPAEPAADQPAEEGSLEQLPDRQSDEVPPAAEPAPGQPKTTTEEPEPLVTVAEAEPVHEEREAQVEPVAPAILPRVRILGRRRPLGHGTPSAVDILINEPAFRDAQAHAISSPEREVAGVLVGPPPEKQPDGRYVVHITDMIIARHTRMHGASVTYTPESWRYVNDRLAQLYPDDTAVIVGWYHTHPGFGIFLSGMDRFIHHNFFTQIWHVALVLDPLARRSGFFSWDRAKTRVDAYDFPWPQWAAESW